MNKVAIVYWTGSGNTEQMANMIGDAVKNAGGEATVSHVSAVSIDDLVTADVIALGSPSMGVEVIEESEMEPFMASLEGRLQDKKVALFGSYGWGDGQWIRDWSERIKGNGANEVVEALAVQGTPEGAECAAFGANLAKA